MNPTTQNILYMLKESNAIEGEYDDDSLIDAKMAWDTLIKYERLTPTLVKLAHGLLMCTRDIEPKYRGDWRDVPIWIGYNKKNQPKIVIDSLMRDFCEDINKLPKNVLSMHIRFEDIHPFIDGNGRMGRIIMNWHSLKRGENLLIFTAHRKHEMYYPIFTDPKHITKALKFARQETHDNDYFDDFTSRLLGKGNH